MGVERKAVDGPREAARDVERRLIAQERRYVPQAASDLLGPGYGPRSIQLLDWNAEETTFDGHFYSPAGSINSPDGAYSWFGVTAAEVETYTGTQTVTSGTTPAGSPLPIKAARRWYSNDGGGTRLYTPWIVDAFAQASMVKLEAQSIPDAVAVAETTVFGWTPADPNLPLTLMGYSNGVWTPQIGGLYEMTGLMTYDALASGGNGQRVIRLRKNGALVHGFNSTTVNTYVTPLTIIWSGFLALGDTLTMTTSQTNGSTVSTFPSRADYNHLLLKRVTSPAVLV